MLENRVLEATVADKMARAGENQIDAELKVRKAEVEAAKARKLHSDADRSDLDYIEKDNGFREQYEMSEKDKDRDHQMNLVKAQAYYGGKNEQIGIGA